MNISYSFLNDELALNEIRKHQWIESQKSGRPVGFPTAAVDWIKNHGEEWRKNHTEQNVLEDSFTEKRRLRRFDHHFPVEIVIDGQHLLTQTLDCNIVGFRCRIPYSTFEGNSLKVIARLARTTNGKRDRVTEYETSILRADKYDSRRLPDGYDIFVPWNKEARDFLRSFADFLEPAY